MTGHDDENPSVDQTVTVEALTASMIGIQGGSHADGPRHVSCATRGG